MLYVYPLFTKRHYEPKHFLNAGTARMISENRLYVVLGSSPPEPPGWDNVCAVAKRIEIDDILVGFNVTFELTPNMPGSLLKEIIKVGAKIQFFPSGIGSLNKDGTVQDDYRFTHVCTQLV